MFECFLGAKWGPCKKGPRWGHSGPCPIEPLGGGERTQKKKGKKKLGITIRFLGAEEGVVH